MDEDETDPWLDEDHVRGGAQALESIGFPRDEAWTASAGYSELGLKQVLVFGFNYVAIVLENGQVLLDAGHREVRGVRQRDGVGLEVWVTSASPDPVIRPRKWLHRISDLNATALEEHWFNLSPITHSGIGLNPLHWREDEYSYFVGRVVSEAAKCDVSLAGLATAGKSSLGQSTGKIQGESGTPLADVLDELGSYSPAISEISERYRAWFDWRNFVVHGVRKRDQFGKVTDQVAKWSRYKKSSPSNVVVDVQEQDFKRLALVWHAYYMLNHDAWRTAIYIYPSESPEKVLRDLPMPNSVSDAERLPPT